MHATPKALNPNLPLKFLFYMPMFSVSFAFLLVTHTKFASHVAFWRHLDFMSSPHCDAASSGFYHWLRLLLSASTVHFVTSTDCHAFLAFSVIQADHSGLQHRSSPRTFGSELDVACTSQVICSVKLDVASTSAIIEFHRFLRFLASV